jgi:hypothetical protein
MPPMKKVQPAATPAQYVASLRGWQAGVVRRLRAAVRASAPLEEMVKWGNLVYFSNGPVIVLRAEPGRVLFGFWRGQRLVAREPRLRPSGKYEMATIVLDADTTIGPTTIRRLTRAAVALNRSLGDPTRAATSSRRR